METTLSKITIAYYIASPTWGGGEQYVYNLALEMKRRSAKLVFFFPSNSSEQMVARFRAIGECPTFRFSSKFWRFSYLAAFQFSKLLDKYHVDILHINSRQSYHLAARAKRLSHRNIRLIATQHLVRKAKDSRFWRQAYQQIDTLICVSQCVQSAYTQPWSVKSITPPFSDIQVVSNSVPIHSTTTSSSLSSSNDNPRIFYHGRICQEKGIIQYMKDLESLSHLPFTLVIAGSVAPEVKEDWDKLLTKSPIRSQFEYLGFRSDIAQIAQTCHIGILPSIVAEACSMTLLENMALGLPTISSNNGSQPEFIDNYKNGILCPPKDSKAWMNATQLLITDASLREQMGIQAQQDFRNKFNFEQYIQKMLDIYSYNA